jgi:hypothetical protein
MVRLTTRLSSQLRLLNAETGETAVLDHPVAEEAELHKCERPSHWTGPDGRLRLGLPRGRRGVEVWDLGGGPAPSADDLVPLRRANKTGE